MVSLQLVYTAALTLCFSLLPCFAQVYQPPPGYDKYTRPQVAVTNNPDAPAEEVEIEIDLVDVFSVGMQGVMKIRLRVVESWVDPRLDSIDHEDEEFRMKANANALWHPDGRVQHNVDTKTQSQDFFVMSGGQVVRIRFINFEVSCEFYFAWLPFDWQDCEIPYVEKKLHTHEIKYIPLDFNINDDITMSEWLIIDNYIDGIELSFSNSYFDYERPGVVATVIVQRQIGYYTKFVFVPSILLVFISYSSFYITHKATPARTLLGVVPILTSLTTLAANMAQMPRFSYQSWLIMFLFTNTIFNVITMLEFAFVAYVDHMFGDKKENALNEQIQNLGIQMNMLDMLNPNKEKEPEEEATCRCFQRLFQSGKNQVNVWEKACNCVYKALRKYFDKRPKVIDKLFRLFFLVTYMLVLLILFMLPFGATYDG